MVLSAVFEKLLAIECGCLCTFQLLCVEAYCVQ